MIQCLITFRGVDGGLQITRLSQQRVDIHSPCEVKAIKALWLGLGKNCSFGLLIYFIYPLLDILFIYCILFHYILSKGPVCNSLYLCSVLRSLVHLTGRKIILNPDPC